MKTPPPRSRICGTKACAVSRIDFTLTAKMRSNSASSISISGLLRCVVPALLTTMSTRPKASMTVLAARSTSARFDTSAQIAMPPPPNRLAAASATSVLRSRQATRAPSRTKISAMPKPNPCPAPVTSAVLPFSRSSAPSRARRSDRLFPLLDQLVVDRLGAQIGGPHHQTRPIILKGRALVDPAVKHAPADQNADIDIGRSETVACNILGAIKRALERRQRALDVAVADHALALDRNLEPERLVGDRRIERAGGKEEPAVVGPPL